MATYLLDTSVIIDTLRGIHGRGALLQDLLKQGHFLACCPTNISEIYAGLRDKEEPKTTAFLEDLEYYEITWSIARQAGLLKREYSRRGQALSLADTTIAAVCLANDLTLMTNNVKDFPMPELVLYPLPGTERRAKSA